MRNTRGLLSLLLGLLMVSCATGGVQPVYIRYEPARELSSLQQKLGPTVGLAPFKDERRDSFYVGINLPFMGNSDFFKSEPHPLERAIKDSLSQVFSARGVKTVPVGEWDGKPESLKNIGSDSVLKVEIRKFWVDGLGSFFQTNVRTSVVMVIHLGVKKEGKVFTRNIDIEREMFLTRLTPRDVEQSLNQILAELFDSFLFNPY